MLARGQITCERLQLAVPNSSRKSRIQTDHLVERVGSCSPVGKEHAEADSLEDAADKGDGDGVHWAFLGDNLCDDL